MHHFFHGARPFFAKGSLSLILGNLAMSVRVSPNGMLTLEEALIAHPLALSRGEMLRLRSLSHAKIIAGPEIMRRIPTNNMMSSHHLSSASPVKRATRAEPIMPTAIPMAAKIPANLAISNGGLTAAAAFGSVPSAGVATVIEALLILALAFSIIFASFSAAFLLIRSSTVLDMRRYGDQKAWPTLIGLSTIFVITASHSTPSLS